MATIRLEKITTEALRPLWELSYGPAADLSWMALNGPYFDDPVLTWKAFSTGFGAKSIQHPLRRLIMADGELLGIVSAYWEDGALQHWLETGIVLYDSSRWGQGLGTKALHLWLVELFEQFPDLPHLSFTTWSGNRGMQRAGEKAGMQKEGVIRKVRYWQGTYYDSVKYGILREELIR